MISCPKCGKENQDHYKFCLGCGNELPRDGGGQRPFQPTPPAGVPAAGGASARGPAPGPAPFGGPPVGAPAPFGAPPAPSPFGGPAPAVGGPSPFGGPPAPAPFGAPPPAPAPFGGAPAGGPSPFGGPPVGAPAPFGGAPPGPPAPAPGASVAPPGGARVAPTCSQCGSPNPRGNRFCLTCGNDLTIAGSPASMPAPPGPAPVVAPFGGPAVASAAPAAPPFAASQPPVAMPAPVSAPVPPPAAPAGGFGAPAFAGPGPSGQPSRARLVLIRPDGTEGGMFQLNEGTMVIGRETGPLFANDTYLSPRHATFTVNGSTVSVRDERSLNGVYVRIERQAPTEIRDGDIFRIGQEILRYDAYQPVQPETDGTERQGAQIEGLVGRISLLIGRDVSGNAFPVPVTGLFLGRERGDILFPEDGYVSGLHCQLAVEGGKLMLTDVGSSNGTYVRLKAERQIRNNDLLLMGQQLFRLTLA